MMNCNAHEFARLVAHLPGDLAEFGVYRGDTFKHLAKLAKEHNKIAWAVDSFCGMGDPGEFDGKDYPKGKFDIGGVAAFHALMSNAGVESRFYRTCPGFIPDVLAWFMDERFCFAYVDLDHYDPTKALLTWLWPKMTSKGILMCDDFFPGRGLLAGKAIDEFAEEIGQAPVAHPETNQCHFLKP